MPYPVPPPGQAYGPAPHGQAYSPGTPVHPYAPQQWGDARYQSQQTLSRPGGGRRAGLWFVLASAALLCLVGAAVIGWKAMDRGPAHPDTWDPVVLELVDFVEAERGIEFDHPVYVDFLAPEEYRVVAGGVADVDAVDDEQAAYAQQAAEDDLALYRSIGLLSGAPDLTAAGESLLADGTAAFYDPSQGRIAVSGLPVDGALPIELQSVVVHELAHALQDQLAGLGDDEPATTEEADALLALLEGDAMVVEQAFVAQLDPAVQEQIAATETARGDAAEAALAEAGVPEVLSVMFSLPYAFGPSWVAATLEGPGGVDLAEMLDGPRPTTAQVLGMVPRSELEPATEVEELEAPAGAEVLYHDTWGAFSWAVSFASWVDTNRTAAAIAGWDGDAVVVYVDERDRVCFDALVETTSDAGAAAFADAVGGWIEQLPAESGANWAIDGRSVSLTSCDPGAEVVVAPSQDLTAALKVMATRNGAIAGLMIGGVPRDPAGCFADGMLDAFGADRLADDELVGTPEFERVRAELALRCRI